MKTIVIIPARYGSTRFPGKPLAKICDDFVITAVCRNVAETGFEFAVATDDDRIADVVREAGFKAVLTPSGLGSGTERVAEACRLLDTDADIVVNVQGDEPLITAPQIRMLAESLAHSQDADIATLVRVYDPADGLRVLEDPNNVKVVEDFDGNALYFSRSVIPHVEGAGDEWWKRGRFLLHVGVYAYRTSVLREIVGMPESELERDERLEQLRWLQAGKKVKLVETDYAGIGNDTPEDLKRAETLLRNRKR